MISVVMCTYNGQKYLWEQLDSLRTQTLTPDEVIILDDASTDETAHLIRSYMQKYALTNWHLTINPTNIGWKQNFMNGIARSTGDLIFLCDQDDIWHADKLQIMTATMAVHPEITLLACNYVALRGAHAHSLRKTAYPVTTNDGSLTPHRFTREFLMIDRPGCTYCFRRTLLRFKDNVWFETMPHDAFLYRAADLSGGFYILNRTLMDYRRHAENCSDHNQYTRAEHLRHVKYQLHTTDALINTLAADAIPDAKRKLRILRASRDICEKQIRMLETHSFLYLLALLPKLPHYPAPLLYGKDIAIFFGLSSALKRLRTRR